MARKSSSLFRRNFDLASLGFPQSFVNAVAVQEFPDRIPQRFRDAGGGVGWKEQPGYNYSLQSNLSMQRGKHLMKTGVQFNLFRGNFLSNTILPAISFAPAQTGGPTANLPAAGTGLAMASFLYGFASGGSIEYDTGVSIQNVYYGFSFRTITGLLRS